MTSLISFWGILQTRLAPSRGSFEPLFDFGGHFLAICKIGSPTSFSVNPTRLLGLNAL